ncbi:proline dipeptidase [Rhizobium rhizosphaerae]|uniref:Proline dipeptidase n=1 Tax=Xaviernesmea rhizosphaerae TaxID=1672749 RepID=A0A1Q9ANP6_9HYPH|nr:Xaa-Pro peptidase family protein [Xaviernesmea rhizosphaerae]OLP57019.1 proline dipeptidase [Xaviernesmea rhizosphaerae]
MSEIDRQRAARLMQAEGLEALVLFQPDAFRYATGAPAGVAAMWGRAGAAIALVPADAALPIAAVISDHAAPALARLAPAVERRVHGIWIDQLTLGPVSSLAGVEAAYAAQGLGRSRPETFDRAACFVLLGDLLQTHGLSSARIGVDLAFLPAADFTALEAALPRVRWVDGSLCLMRLRAVKTPREIARLRQASQAAEAGLRRMAEAVADGVPLATLSAAWKAGAADAAARGGFTLTGTWDYLSVGPDLADPGARVAPGALIKADVGTLVEGYSSDGARTYSFGRPPDLARDIFAVLEEAFEAGLAAIRPGARFGDVHAAMSTVVHGHGLTRYARGHFGHSVGGGMGIEEAPFFSTGNPERIEPGMVLAIEAPFYGQGLGALMIEEMVLVTETGTERIDSLPRGLVELG